MGQGPKRIMTWLLTAAVLLATCGWATSRDFYFHVSYSPFLWVGLASVCIIHFRVKWSVKDALIVLAGIAALAAVVFGIRGLGYNTKALFGWAGLASVSVLAIRWLRAAGEEQRELLWLLVPSLLFVGQGWLAPITLGYTMTAHPKTLDLYLYAFECSLRFQPSRFLGVVFGQWPPLAVVSWVLYLAVPVPMALVYAEQYVRVKQRALPIVLAILYSTFVGFLFYNLFPACGPKYLFGGSFPGPLLPAAQAMRLYLEPVAVRGPRNAMPSLHLAWVLLTWWYSRGGSKLSRAMLMAFLIFTVLATLGTGEHYFADLVVAFPFLLLVQTMFAFGMSWTDPIRIRAFVIGLGVTLAWLAALRWGTSFFWISPWIPWALVVATIVPTSFLAADLSSSWEAPEPGKAAPQLSGQVVGEENPVAIASTQV
jgi:PAP2 superfamily